MMDQSLKGRLVVAAPNLLDGIFDGAVVLLLEHAPEGAVGLVLNRPAEVAPSDILPGLPFPVAEPPTVFVGGPVAQDQAVGLAQVPDGVRLLHLEGDEDGLEVDIDAVRVFVGHAGWGPGQLDSEVAAGAWFVVDAEVEDAFTREPDGLWRQVLARQGGMFRTVPADPSLN